MSGLVVCLQHKPLESNQGLPCGVLDVARCFTPIKHTGLNRTRHHNLVIRCHSETSQSQSQSQSFMISSVDRYFLDGPALTCPMPYRSRVLPN